MNNTNENKEFFLKNDIECCKRMLNILNYIILAFPAIFLGIFFGLFNIKYTDLLLITIFGVIVSRIPSILYKRKLSLNLIKYTSIICISTVIALLGGNSNIGIYMTYGLPLLLSCLFFNKVFTRNICIINYLLLVISLYLRSTNIVQIEFETNFMWFISRTIGFTIEAVVMSIFFIKLSSITKNLLDTIFEKSQGFKKIVSNCHEMSLKLDSTINVLEDDINDSNTTNDSITKYSNKTIDDLNISKEHVNNTINSINEMSDVAETINNKTKKLLDISESTTNEMEVYTISIDNTVTNMNTIKDAVSTTEESIHNLANAINEITQFTETISDITSQTNLLALNASIEAARAGEHGKGFSVVADSVRELADQSKVANDAINHVVNNIAVLLEEVKKSNNANTDIVDNSILKINKLKEATKNIVELQLDTKEMTQNISEYCGKSKEHSDKVTKMILEMDNIVNSSLDCADNIVKKTEKQVKVISNVHDSFLDVRNISNELLSIKEDI